MTRFKWQKIISLILTFAIVFNITMVPVLADENDSTDAPAQEEQVADAAFSEETEEDEGTEAQDNSEQQTSDEEQPLGSEQEQPADDEQEPAAEETPEQPVEAPSENQAEEHVGGEGKYVKDVYIAYGKTEDEAKDWLRKHKWEPLSGNADFNAGKASAFDKDVAAVMGIRRTDNEDEAITDMAVMNMKGGYSFPDYQSLLKEKKAEINEFIDTFIPVLSEYRANYNGKGSKLGKKRAELAHDILNRFYDGGKDDPYKLNDTGKPLGDLLLDKTVQEGNKNGGDLQQIILESSGASVTTVETCLAFAADAEETPWLERIGSLSGDELSKNLSKYVPEAEGQDVAPSAVNKFLKQNFGDQAKILAGQWNNVHEAMVWYEEYNDKNDLWKHDGESDKEYEKRTTKYFRDLDKKADGDFSDEQRKYLKAAQLYACLYDIPYEGKWGESLGDFFNPSDGSNYSDDVNSFLPITAAMSKGQKRSVELVNLDTLLLLNMGTEASISDLFTQFDSIFGDAESISIYSGINRGIFRGGVALTNAALMEKNQSGYDPFSDMWSFSGIYNITTYASAITGVLLLGTGIVMARHAVGAIPGLEEKIPLYENMITSNKRALESQKEVVALLPDGFKSSVADETKNIMSQREANIEKYQGMIDDINDDIASYQKMTTAGRVITGIGGALLVGAAIAKGYQLYRYYQKTFTQIPMYIVDEADIVSYKKDDEGNDLKLINFDQYVYYEVAKCNRQEVGKISGWQDGVSDYASWGCGDAADLNGDFGQQWLALYTVKSEKKGYPILADSLTLQYGSSKMPEGTTKALHMFTYDSTVDLGDTAYSYNNDKKGVYFFWDVDEKAFEENDAASAFAGGNTMLAGGLGLLIGILGTAIVMRKKRKEA